MDQTAISLRELDISFGEWLKNPHDTERKESVSVFIGMFPNLMKEFMLMRYFISLNSNERWTDFQKRKEGVIDKIIAGF